MRVKYLIPFLVLILVLNFGLFTSCKAEEIIEKPAKEKIIEPVEEKIVEKPTEEEQPIKEEPQQAQYCGSINSDVYHYPYCRYVKQIKSYNIIWFNSAQDAINHGYRPCKVCKPPR